MEIDLFDNFKQVDKLLDDLTEREISLATRRALKRTSTTARLLAIKRIKKERRLTSTFIKQRLPLFVRASGTIVSNMGAKLEFSAKPIGLIHFVNKSSLKKRVGLGGAQLKGKRVTARIKPGKSTKLRKAFYAQGRNNNDQIFQRSSKKRLPLKKSSTPSLSAIISKGNRLAALSKVAAIKFSANFTKELEFRLDKKMGRISSRNLKKRR